MIGLIPAAGSGTRMYPFTRANPKELFPIDRKAVIDHVLETMHDFAGVNKVFGVGLAGGVLKSLLGSTPSDAEIYIKQAQERLKTNNYANDKEKAILEGIANQSGKDMGVVHNNMVGLTGINFKLGKEKGKDIPFNNKVPDYSTSTAKKKAAQLIKETKEVSCN